MENFQEKLNRVLAEGISIVPYKSQWATLFEKEKQHLLKCTPTGIIKRIEHFGSTSILNLAAKPIVDILGEVTSLEKTKQEIVPILEAQGYDYFWRALKGDDVPPFYAWFIKRDFKGNRTHHIHMVEKDSELWDNLLFRDYLIKKPVLFKEYQRLKLRLAEEFSTNRVAYTEAKSGFIERITEVAKRYYSRN